MEFYSTSSGWEKVHCLSVIRQIPETTVVFHQGDVPQEAIFLKNGWIKLVRQERESQDQIIALCPPGGLLGIAEMIAERLHPATAITLTKCELYSAPAPAFLNFLKSDSQLCWQIQRILSRQINAHDIRSAQFKGLPSRLRLEQLLWKLLYAQNYHRLIQNRKLEGGKLFIPLQYQELAQMIAVTPQYLSCLFKQMEHEGLIRRHKHWLIVNDPERLWRAPDIQVLAATHSIQFGEVYSSEVILA
jgi:CRP/FNR family transcriptional regulator, cyclic AMP receptor protein